MRDYVIAKIKITRYGWEGEERFLAKITQGKYETSFNEGTLKRVLKRLVEEIN